MKMRHSGLGLCLAMAICSPAAAGIFADDLGRCVVTATTIADRSALMRWMFVTAAANPAFADLATVTPAERQGAVRAAAAVYDRLLLHTCRRETMAAMRNEGATGLEVGFQALGMAAGREMMNSPAGSASLGQLVENMDSAGLEALAREAGVPMPPRPAPPR
jgi:hypothetical protein